MRRTDREIAEREILNEIIGKSDVCRVAFADNNIPYIVTMNFGYSDEGLGILWFHCATEGRKLEMIKKNNFVCFEMDTDHRLYGGEQGCDWGMSFSSIVGYGKISIITDNTLKLTGLNAIMAHYAGNREFSYDEAVISRTTILKLEITEISGKKK
jgi:nitroimidazol reductase NimA-like FMN-containing flavoprotein (pyridoxamine 5'-phosphate oxidase superfamily)